MPLIFIKLKGAERHARIFIIDLLTENSHRKKVRYLSPGKWIFVIKNLFFLRFIIKFQINFRLNTDIALSYSKKDMHFGQLHASPCSYVHA